MTAEAEADLAPGTRIEGGYNVIRRISAGGMGTVYEATGPLEGRRYALKTVNRALQDNPLFVARFKEEAAHLANIRSDAVVRSLGFLEDRALGLFLVMEYIDGETLDEHVKRRGALTEPELKRLRGRLAEALREIHGENIVHRDLSPENVLLPGGDVGRAKLIDFGISKPPESAGPAAAKAAKWPDGKFLWMAPEQLSMDEVGAPADHYSAGLVLAYAAVGHPLPLGGLSPQQALEKRHQPIDLGSVPKSLQPELRRLLHPSPRWRGRLTADHGGRTFRRAALGLALFAAGGLLVYEFTAPDAPPPERPEKPDAPVPAQPPPRQPDQPNGPAPGTPVPGRGAGPDIPKPPGSAAGAGVPGIPDPLGPSHPPSQPIPTCTSQSQLDGPGWVISQTASAIGGQTRWRVNGDPATIDLRVPGEGEVVAEGYLNVTGNDTVELVMTPGGDTSEVYCHNVQVELDDKPALQTNWYGIRARNPNSYAFGIKPASLRSRMTPGIHKVRLRAACAANAFPSVGVTVRTGNTLPHAPGRDEICRARTAAAERNAELELPTAAGRNNATPPLVPCDQLVDGTVDGWLVQPWNASARRGQPGLIDFAALPEGTPVNGPLNARALLQLPADGTVTLQFALADPAQPVMCGAMLTIDQGHGRGFQGGGAIWRTLANTTTNPNPRQPILTKIQLNRGTHSLDLSLTCQARDYLPTIRFSLQSPLDSAMRAPKPNEVCVPKAR